MTQPAASDVVSIHARVVGAPGSEAVLRAEHDDVAHYAASTMKVPVQIAFERLVAAGLLSADEPVLVDPEFDSQVREARFTMREEYDQDPETWAAVGTVVPLAELVRRMVVRSGNLATNLVFDRVGPAAVAEVLAAADCSARTRIRRGIEDAPAREAGLDNLVTARDLALLLEALAAGRLGPPVVAERVEAVLGAQEHVDGIPAGLPEGVWVGNKTGFVDGLNHDFGLIRAPGRPPLSLAVLVTADGTEAERQATIAAVTRDVWARFTARFPEEVSR